MRKILPQGRLVKYLCGIVIAIACMANIVFTGDFIFQEATNLWHGLSSKNWDRTVGTIESSFIRTEKGKNTKYIPAVSYRYMVDGRIHHSSRIEAASRYSQESAFELVSDFPAQAEVPVFHDRESGLSALRTGVRSDTYIGLAVGIVWMIVGPGFLLLALLSLFQTPEAVFQAEWRLIRQAGFRKVRDMNPVEREKAIQFELAVEKEIAERKSEIARRKGAKGRDLAG